MQDYADSKSDELDCGLVVIIHNDNFGSRINRHHKKVSFYGQLKAGNYRKILAGITALKKPGFLTNLEGLNQVLGLKTRWLASSA
jgi:hypothetical protein